MTPTSDDGARRAASASSRGARPADVELVARSDESAAMSDDASLVRAMAAGDERALGTLYDRWSASVRALGLHMLRSPDEADALTEETFWQAWRQADRYDTGRGSVCTWLLTVARSRSLDRLRSRARSREETRAADDGAFDAAAARDESSLAAPDEAVEASERRTIVEAVVRTLPAEQREAVMLAYFGGLSQTEIAERTGQPLGTVKTRIRLALRKLREQLIPFAEGAL
jgi:RNA polymerase sigma-70 factor, ECF subfamily